MNNYSRFLANRTSRMRSSEIRELLKITEGKDVISFAGGLPDPSLFMLDEISKITNKIIKSYGDKALQYAPTKGVTAFRDTLTRFLSYKGIKINEYDDIIITTGSQQALYLILKILVNPNELAVVEEPTYIAALNVLRELEAKLEAVDIDDEGMKTDTLEERIKSLYSEDYKIKLAYVNPTCQNPTGTTMSNDRRKHLLELASRYDFLIIEDDPYSYFTFENTNVKPLKSLDEEGRVIYLGTFSKILAPGLRIGWALGAKELINNMELAKQSVDLHSSSLSQYIAMECIKRGIVDKTIERARELYKTKRDAMLEVLENELSEVAIWTKPIGGLFVFLWLKRKIDTKDLLPKAIEKGVAYVPGKAFFVKEGGSNTMRLNFSYPSIPQIKEGIKRLKSVIKDY
jgi:2-aminoadipate transaminase